MTSLTRDPGLAFDLETTGLDSLEDRIVEVAAVLSAPGLLEERSQLVRPGIPVPPEASAIHGITDRKLAGKPLFRAVAPRFWVFLTGGAMSLGRPWICSYAASRLDVPMLNAELARAGHPGRVDAAEVLDPLVFARWHLRHLRSRTLASACERMGVAPPSHRALADARATAALLAAMVGQGLVPDDLRAALAAQRLWEGRLEDEWDLWAYWLYADRATQEVRLGCGQHCGRLLREAPGGYLRSILDMLRDERRDPGEGVSPESVARVREELSRELDRRRWRR